MSSSPDYRVWRGTLTGFGGEVDGKHVKKAGFVLQATDDGGVWDTLSADTYRIFKRAGDVEIRAVDDSGDAVDLTAYTDWQEAGNPAFRATYTVTDNGSETTYTNEALTLYEMIVYPMSGELNPLAESDDIGNDAITSRKIATNIQSDNYSAGASGWKIWRNSGNAEFNDVTVRGTIYATAGEIANWDIGVIDAYTISADTGKAKLNAQTPYISLGASVSGYLSGNGFWVGKHSGAYKFFVGDSAGAYVAFDGTKLIKHRAKNKGASELGDSDDGASDTDVLTVYGHMQSDDWVSGVTGTGWRISNAGRAVFRNIVARGSIRSSVFEADVVSAVAGTMVIAKSAGKLDVNMSVPGSGTWTMSIEDPPGTGWLFANSDIIRVKESQGSVSETWFTVTRGTQSGGHQTYTCTFQSGTRPASYEKGLGVLDYGASGQGFLELSADGSGAPYYSVRTHAGSPWTTVTERGRFGNMLGAFGIASNYYGFGVGDYSGGNYLRYDTNGGFKIAAGGDDVIVDESGVTLAAGVGTTNMYKVNDGTDNIARWYAEVDGTVTSFSIIGEGKDSSHHEAYLELIAITDDGVAHAGAASVTFTLDTSTNRADLTAGKIALAAQAVTVSSPTSTTNAANNALYLDAYTSGTAAAGFGSSILLRGEDDGGTIRDMGRINAVWRTATSGSRKSALDLAVYDGASYTSWLSMTTTGVGVGVTDPGYLLHLKGDSTNLLALHKTSSGGYAQMVFLRSSDSSTRGGVTYDNTNDVMWLGNAGAAVLTWNQSGNVGIGTASPDALLDLEKSHTDYTTSFMRLTNTSATGQTPLDFYINGTLRGKVRADYVGNMNYIAAGGSHTFLVGGDSGSGTVTATLGTGLQMGSPTGGDKGAGTINVATNIYKNNTAYTNPDYVLERWATGKIEKYASRAGAQDYRRMSLAELESHIRNHHRLPRIDDEPAGIFDMADMALEKIEELFTHVIELNHRLTQLEARN